MKRKLGHAILLIIIRAQFWLEKLRLNILKQEFSKATAQDVYYSYRLFLNREPDPQGFQHFKELIDHHGVAVDYLTDAFLYSAELQENQARRHQPVLVELPDFRQYVRLDDHFIGAAVARDKVYEANVSRILREHLRPGCTFIDIGANIGYFSMLAGAILNNTGRIISFEPVKENRELFSLSVKANNFENIELYPYAVSNREQIVALEVGGRNSNSRMVAVEQGSTNSLQVKTVVLDDFLSDLEALDVIKIDIEGAEPLALQGMRTLLEKYRPFIVTEFSPRLIEHTSQIKPGTYLNFLQDLGYSLRVISDHAETAETSSPQQIMARFENNPGLEHLDLLAAP